MRTTGDSSEPETPFSELVRLQMDFHARLAEETLRFLRRVQASGLPATPSTVVRADRDRPPVPARHGETIRLVEHVENRQRVHAIVTALLTPLVSADGTTWFPQSEAATLIVPPDDSEELAFDVEVPDDLPAATYRGAIVLTGLDGGAVPVSITVAGVKRPGRRSGT